MLSNTQCRRFELVSKRHVYKLSNNWLHPDPLISGDLQLLAMIQTALSAVREEKFRLMGRMGRPRTRWNSAQRPREATAPE